MSRIHASTAANGGAAQRQPVPDRGPIGQRQRALDAMARAVGRARDPTGAVVVADLPHTDPTQYAPLTLEARDDHVRAAPSRPAAVAASRTPRRIRLVIAAELAALVALLATFVIVRVAGVDAHRRDTSSTGVANRKATASPASTSTVPAASSQPSPTTTGAAPVPPPGAPVLSALSPPQGSAGEVVGVSGTNLFSGDGQVVTRFGGQVAPTNCTTQTTCTVTVPSLPGAPSTVPVTVTTSSGTSNALLFAYQPAVQPTAQVAVNHEQDPGRTAPSGTEGHGKDSSGNGGD